MEILPVLDSLALLGYKVTSVTLEETSKACDNAGNIIQSKTKDIFENLIMLFYLVLLI